MSLQVRLLLFRVHIGAVDSCKLPDGAAFRRCVRAVLVLACARLEVVLFPETPEQPPHHNLIVNLVNKCPSNFARHKGR